MRDATGDRAAAKMFAALAMPIRLAVLRLLAAGPRHVGAIAESVGQPMVNVSHHLDGLKKAGLVLAEKAGRRQVYSLNPAVFAAGPAGDPVLGVFAFEGFRVSVYQSTAG